MVSIAIAGDCTTTTALALAAAWPNTSALDVAVVELDPTGGSIAAWLDAALSPSLSTAVTALHRAEASGAAPRWTTVESLIRRSTSGVRFIPAPFRTLEARSAIAEAEKALLPILDDHTETVALLDVGRIDPSRIPTPCRHAEMTLMVHRLDGSSSRAATVRLERLAETIDALTRSGHRTVLVVIGDDPFGLDEVASFAAPDCPAWTLAVDDLAAAVFAGRSGVSARRLARLPLVRTAAIAAAEVEQMLSQRHRQVSLSGAQR